AAVSKAASRRAAPDLAVEDDQAAAAVAELEVAKEVAAADAAGPAKPRLGWLRRFRRGAETPAPAPMDAEAVEPQEETAAAPPKAPVAKAPVAKGPLAK